jgi:hypothetical protein
MASLENTATTDLEPRPNFSGFWHGVQLYEHDDFLVSAVAYYLRKGLESGCAGLAITTQPHRDAIEKAFQSRDVDIAAAKASGQYIALDAEETLHQIMVNGWPDGQRFNRVIGAALWTLAKRNYLCFRAFGEMVAILWADGRHEAALHLEKLWNHLSARHAFSLLCAYPLHCFSGEGQARYVLEMCSSHSHVIPAETHTESALASVMQSQPSFPHAGPPPIG